MIDFWLFLALQAVAIVSGMATAAGVLALGGLGGLRALQTRLSQAEDATAEVDRKITRETKRRAADAAVEARGGKSAKAIAEAHLAENQGRTTGGRPSVVSASGSG